MHRCEQVRRVQGVQEVRGCREVQVQRRTWRDGALNAAVVCSGALLRYLLHHSHQRTPCTTGTTCTRRTCAEQFRQRYQLAQVHQPQQRHFQAVARLIGGADLLLGLRQHVERAQQIFARAERRRDA